MPGEASNRAGRQTTNKGNKSKGSSRAGRDSDSEKDSEDELDQEFHMVMLEEYKKDLKIMGKKAFVPNFDYKTKLQSLARLAKNNQEKLKQRPYFIISVEHYVSDKELVHFTMKIVELDSTYDVMVFKNQI